MTRSCAAHSTCWLAATSIWRRRWRGWVPGTPATDTRFATLVQIIAGQQVSTASAPRSAASWQALEGEPTPRSAHSTTRPCATPAQRPKAAYGRGLAEALLAGTSTFPVCSSWRRRRPSPSSPGSRALAAGVPRSTCCSRTAGLMCSPPTIWPCRSPIRGSSASRSARLAGCCHAGGALATVSRSRRGVLVAPRRRCHPGRDL